MRPLVGMAVTWHRNLPDKALNDEARKMADYYGRAGLTVYHVVKLDTNKYIVALLKNGILIFNPETRNIRSFNWALLRPR